MAGRGDDRVFDLRRFAALPLKVRLRDEKVYAFPSDPDVGVIEKMLVFERVIRSKDEVMGITIADAIVESKQLLVELARGLDPSVEDLPVGVADVLTIFTLITGGESVAQMVAETLTDQMGALDDAEVAERLAAGDADGFEAEGRAPLPSKKRSSAPRSRSVSGTAGPRTTGLG